MINMNTLIKKWQDNMLEIERSIFDVLIGKFITHEDIRSTTIFYVYAIEDDGLKTITIEKNTSFLTFASVTLELETLCDYQMVDISLVMSKFSPRMIKLFERLVELS